MISVPLCTYTERADLPTVAISGHLLLNPKSFSAYGAEARYTECRSHTTHACES